MLAIVTSAINVAQDESSMDQPLAAGQHVKVDARNSKVASDVVNNVVDLTLLHSKALGVHVEDLAAENV